MVLRRPLRPVGLLLTFYLAYFFSISDRTQVYNFNFLKLFTLTIYENNMYMIGYSNFNIYPTRTRVKIIGFDICILLEQK